MVSEKRSLRYPRPFVRFSGVLASAFLAGAIMGIVTATAAEPLAETGVTITQRVPFAKGPFESVTRDAAPAAPQAPTAVPFLIGPPPVELIAPAAPAAPAVSPSPAVPTPLVPPVSLAPALSTSFPGLGDPGTVIPPDTMGAAGPSHLVSILNSEVGIFSKSTGVLLVPAQTLREFWSPLGTGPGQPAASPFDPKILYDQGSGRFVAVTLGGNTRAGNPDPSSWLLVAVSETSDPTGAWNRWAIPANQDVANRWADFPGLGIDDGHVYVSCNMFSAASLYQVPKVFVFPKGQLLEGANPVTWMEFRDPFGGGQGFTMQPAHTFGAAPAEYIAHEGYFIAGPPLRRFLRLSTVTFPGGTPTWTDMGFLEVDGYPTDALPNAPQAGDNTGSLLVDTGDHRLLNAVYRNGALWATHNVADNTSARTEAAWYQIDPGAASPVSPFGVPIQQGRIGHASRFYFFPSIAVNANDDVGIGFSGSSPSEFVGGYYTARGVGDPPGTMQSVSLLREGQAHYDKDFGTGNNRWGDFSATSVDPSDDFTFWTLQEYAAAPADTWGTWWGSFSMGGVAAVTLTALPADSADSGSSVVYTALAEGGSGSYEFQFLARVAPDGTFVLAQPYTQTSTWTWDTTGSPPGGYEIRVNARNLGSSALLEAAATIPYSLNPAAPTSVTLEAVPADNTATGDSVTYTATVNDGTGPFEYEFRARVAPAGSFVLAQPYTPTNNWTWNTTGSPPGGYEVQVNVRRAGQVATEASATIPYILTEGVSPPTSVTLNAVPADNTATGGSVTYTATVNDGTGPFEYEFRARVAPAGSFVTAQPYTSTNNWTWDTTGSPAGDYEVQVNVRRAGQPATEASDTIPYVLTP